MTCMQLDVQNKLHPYKKTLTTYEYLLQKSAQNILSLHKSFVFGAIMFVALHIS